LLFARIFVVLGRGDSDLGRRRRPDAGTSFGLDERRLAVKEIGAAVLSLLLSFLSVTVLWALYFLTDVANQTNR
jgi:hypothetical protein